MTVGKGPSVILENGAQRTSSESDEGQTLPFDQQKSGYLSSFRDLQAKGAPEMRSADCFAWRHAQPVTRQRSWSAADARRTVRYACMATRQEGCDAPADAATALR